MRILYTKMIPRVLLPGALVLVILAAAVVFAGCTSAPGQAGPAAAGTSSEPSATAGSGALETTVTIQNFAFSPATITIKPGTAVTWINQDNTPHAIASDPKSPVQFSSGTFAHGASYRFVFSEDGTYPYICSIHPSMKGAIVVAP